jgi:FSR family fosmidomycin resistance protein-like MFS transporter
LFGSTAAAAVLTGLLVALTHNGNLLLAIPLLLVTGFAFVASQSAFVVLGQEYLPNRMGLASGVTLGLAVSLGGAFSPAMGAIADAHGISATILAAGALSVIAALIATTLPGERRGLTPAADTPVDVATQSNPG